MLPHSASEEERFQQRAEAIRNVYEDERNYRDWIDLCERLTEFDELTVAWRLRHIQVVERIIGARRGTGGTEARPTCVPPWASACFPNSGKLAPCCTSPI